MGDAVGKSVINEYWQKLEVQMNREPARPPIRNADTDRNNE